MAQFIHTSTGIFAAKVCLAVRDGWRSESVTGFMTDDAESLQQYKQDQRRRVRHWDREKGHIFVMLEFSKGFTQIGRPHKGCHLKLQDEKYFTVLFRYRQGQIISKPMCF